MKFHLPQKTFLPSMKMPVSMYLWMCEMICASRSVGVAAQCAAFLLNLWMETTTKRQSVFTHCPFPNSTVDERKGFRTIPTTTTKGGRVGWGGEGDDWTQLTDNNGYTLVSPSVSRSLLPSVCTGWLLLWVFCSHR